MKSDPSTLPRHRIPSRTMRRKALQLLAVVSAGLCLVDGFSVCPGLVKAPVLPVWRGGACSHAIPGLVTEGGRRNRAASSRLGALGVRGQDCPGSATWREEGSPKAGTVLVAHDLEADHFFRQAAVLVVELGPQGGKGLILEMATAFGTGEMSKQIEGTPFEGNMLFRGGGSGEDKVTILHSNALVEGCTPVGDSGLYVGGLDSAISMVEQGMASPEQFKFFYNQCEWVPGALEQECAQGLWRVGKIPSNLCLRQMASQSDRPMDNKLKRKQGSPGIPLWDLLRKEIKESPNEELDDGEDKVVPTREAIKAAIEARPPVFLNPQKKMFMGMVIERIYHFCSEQDAVALMPLLDTGAEVFGQKGNDNIEALLKERWGEYSDFKYLLEEDGVNIADDGTVTVDAVRWKTHKVTGEATSERVKERLTMSLYGMIRTWEQLEVASLK